MTASSAPGSSFQLILDTAEALIAEKGCRATTLQDIMDRTGLSKGAIYHYVSGKDELFGLILKARMEKVNEAFFAKAAQPGEVGMEGPLQLIAEDMAGNLSGRDVGNRISLYLLSQMENPKIAALMRELYEFSLSTARTWIEHGQAEGVIPEQVDANKTAALFITLMYGLRVQSVIKPEDGMSMEEMFRFMFRLLQ